MRRRVFDDTTLRVSYGHHYSRAWKAAQPAFQALFLNRAKEVSVPTQQATLFPVGSPILPGIEGEDSASQPDDDDDPHEVLFVGSGLQARQAHNLTIRITDWQWYVPQRVNPADAATFEEYLPERELHSILARRSPPGRKRIILVHGQTGHGKTTFLRHFFVKWLPTNDPALAQDLAVIRVSLGLSSIGHNLEDDVDNRVQHCLRRIAPWLFDDEHLLRMASMEWPMDNAFRQRLFDKYPMGDTKEAKLEWMRSCVMGRPSVENPKSRYHDFNRIVVNYLTVVHRWQFIIVFDNIDQTPLHMQEEAFVLARHKLDWIRDNTRVTYVLAVRSYMLDCGNKECCVRSWAIDDVVVVYPPPISSVLRSLLPYFETECPDTVTLPDELGRYGGIDLEVPKHNFVQSLATFFSILGTQEKGLNLAKLVNYDVRQQLLMVKGALMSSELAWYDACMMALGKGNGALRLSFYDLLSAMLRQDNLLCAPHPEQRFINVFGLDGFDHFSCPLNGRYILKLLSTAPFSVDELIAMLNKLGHPPGRTRKSLQMLLNANIVVSPQGTSMAHHKLQTIEPESE